MIIQFTTGHYKSFNELQTINFRPTLLKSEDKTVDRSNIFTKNDNSFLKIVGVYGANASGKSNLIKAVSFFKQMITSSLESENLLKYEFNPFKLASEKPDNYGFFQIVLMLDEKKYRYGFSLDAKAQIFQEWLFGPAEKNETFYFTRKGSEININEERFKEGTQLPYSNKLRSDALFLTFCSSYDGEISGCIKDFMTEHVIIEGFQEPLSSLSLGGERTLTDSLIKSGNKEVVLKWMNGAGLSFSDISLEELEINKRKYGTYVMLTKNVFDKDGNPVRTAQMNLDYDESQGTKKFYSFIGSLLKVFNTGGIFISDEIDSNFHPALLFEVIRLFQDPKINKAGAQLMFSSHDVNLMNPKIMRRDQFYFTEKTKSEETRIYSLADLKGIRNNADFARQYLSGFYGALPKLDTFLNFAQDENI